MSRNLRFRVLLPVLATATVILVGGIGLWQRHRILNQRLFGDQTLWESTARFHVWPLPYRFAVITNIPAFLTAGVIEWPIGSRWPQFPEIFGFVLFVLFVPVTWYVIGSHLDKNPAANKRIWTILLSFTTLAISAMSTPGYVGYVFSGCVLWLAFAVAIWRVKSVAGR
jgi:hypothetical protein